MSIQGFHVLKSDLFPWLPGVGGSIDPDYQRYVWDRNDNGDFLVYQHQYINSVPSSRIAPQEKIAYNSAIEFDLEISGLIPMGKLYLDYLYIDQSKLDKNMFEASNPTGLSHYFSTGLTISLRFIKIHLPFYMSWENPEKLTIKSWSNYLRPEVNLDINKIIRNSVR